MSKKRLHTKRTTLHFVVGNEQRFPLMLGTNNALRIFMVLSQTKSALVIKISQRYCLLTVWNSDLFNTCFFGRLDFFFSGDMTKISGNMTQVSGNMTSGDLTVNCWYCNQEKKSASLFRNFDEASLTSCTIRSGYFNLEPIGRFRSQCKSYLLPILKKFGV